MVIEVDKQMAVFRRSVSNLQQNESRERDNHQAQIDCLAGQNRKVHDQLQMHQTATRKAEDTAGRLEDENTRLRDTAGRLEDEKAGLRDTADRLEREKAGLWETAGRLEDENTGLRDTAGHLEDEGMDTSTLQQPTGPKEWWEQLVRDLRAGVAVVTLIGQDGEV
jgi:predicted nuclease with TOPRIM domain